MTTAIKQSRFKSFLKSFTLYQKIFLAAVVLLTAGFVIFFPNDMLDEEYKKATLLIVAAITSTMSNPLCELLISKQSKWNFAIDLFLIEVPEMIICIYLGWYAVLGTIVLFWIPVDIVSFIRWSKHPDQEDENLTVVKRLKPWQTLLVAIGICVFGIVIGKLLKSIPGASDTYLDAFASAVGIANGVLLLLRYSEQWIAWLITTVIYIFMNFSQEAYISLIGDFAMLINTIYGMVKWYLYTKKQEQLKKE